MPLFGISKQECQDLINKAIEQEALTRSTTDQDLYQLNGTEAQARRDAINDEANTRYASDQQLSMRIAALESGTPIPTPPPTATLVVQSAGETSATDYFVILEGTWTPADANVVVVADQTLETQQGASQFRWSIKRGEIDTELHFLMTVSLVNKPEIPPAMSTAVLTIPAREQVTPPPDPITHELTIPASSFTIGHSLTLAYEFDHFSNWGQPGESVSVNVHAEEATSVKLWLDYVLARESAADTDRVIGPLTMSLDPTCDLWNAPVRDWSDAPVEFEIPKGDTNISIEVPADSPAWSNWLDLYAARIRSDKPITVVTA